MDKIKSDLDLHFFIQFYLTLGEEVEKYSLRSDWTNAGLVTPPNQSEVVQKAHEV